MATRSKASVCGRSSAEIVCLNPVGGMKVCWVCCMVSGRGLCDELITCSEESYRVRCGWVWSCILDNEKALTHCGLLCHVTKSIGSNIMRNNNVLIYEAVCALCSLQTTAVTVRQLSANHNCWIYTHVRQISLYLRNVCHALTWGHKK
jgi:hypothetical protein